MQVLRTPDERFDDLAGFDLDPHYVEIPDGEGGSLRVHHLDEGDPHGEVALLMHGEPSWSYLWRKVVPGLVDSGIRAVAPDLVGFGRSDKPADRHDYTYARSVDWMASALFDDLDLRGITLVCQDWGGLIGLRLVAAQPERFSRIVVANTGLPTGDTPMSEAFLAWQSYSQETSEFPVGRIVAGGCATPPSPEVVAAYDAPFPDESYKEAARIFPALVPTGADDPASEANRRAWEELRRFERPLLTAFSDGDPITGGGDRIFQKEVPGARGRGHTTIEGAGHFLQEDKGEELARLVVALVRDTPVP